MLSFEFGKDEYIVFSIETRKEIGQFYSAIRGFFRQYELIYIVSGERDLVRLRTNYRTGEDVYLYHLNMDPARARARFLEYIDRNPRMGARRSCGRVSDAIRSTSY
jgi:hypothetical protein